MNTRATWVDYGKGIGIILMAYAHLQSSAYHSGIQIPERFFALTDSIIYGFHMPFFFFLSGLFVESSFQKRGAKDYLLDKFTRIFYPYIIWSALQVSVEVMFSNQTQQGATLPDLFAVIYRPWGQFWFLYALLLMHITYVIFSRFGKYALALMFGASIILFFYPLSINLFGFFGFRTHFIFFASGILLSSQTMKTENYALPLWAVTLLLAALVGSGYFIFTNLIPPVRLVDSSNSFYFLYLSIIGIIACSALSQYFARNNSAHFLQTLGTYSLQIYLVHMLAGAGIRMVLLHVLSIQNWVTHLIIGVSFALIAPIILQKLSDRLNFPYLFELRKKPSTSQGN